MRPARCAKAEVGAAALVVEAVVEAVDLEVAGAAEAEARADTAEAAVVVAAAAIIKTIPSTGSLTVAVR